MFIDFEGTITSGDVGYEMFSKFTNGLNESTVDLYRNGKINSFECLERECEIWNQAPPDQKAIFEFLANRQLRAGFPEFVSFLGEQGITPVILSEGFDFYIDHILKVRGLGDIERISNRARIDDGVISPEFPYYGQGCGQCSNCKGYHIRKSTLPGDISVFIGDGHSDVHASECADLLFARSFLKYHLAENGRFFYNFEDFHDIRMIFDEIMEREICFAGNRIDLCRQNSRHHKLLKAIWESGEVMKHVGFPDGLGWDGARYEAHWSKVSRQRENFHIALEDKEGNFLGEAKLSAPGDDGYSSHDLKLAPEYWGRGFAREAWQIMLQAAARRWPESRALVTPSVENLRAIKLYESLGFEIEGGELEWIPSETIENAVPVRYRRMIRSQKTGCN
jgi:2,3-diketo-5-methylthio-1-phosphopentane phosphatase